MNEAVQPPAVVAGLGAPRASARRRRLRPEHWWGVAVLVAIALVVGAVKMTQGELSAWAWRWLSLEHLSASMKPRAEHLLFAPLGALIVVIFRLTLGLRVLGPFRSVLLAIAFQVTGPVVGVTFFALVLSVVMVVRPVLKRMHLPYFGRSAALLVAVAGMIVAGVLVGLGLGLHSVERVAYFPVVVLTLAGEAFATAWRREGKRSAVWRAAVTAGAALLISALASIPAMRDFVMRYPEFTLLEFVGVLVVCEFLNLKLFQRVNPPPVKRKKPRSGGVGGVGGRAQTASMSRTGTVRESPTTGVST